MRAGLQAGLDTAASIADCFEISPVTGRLTVKPQVAAAIGKALNDKWAAMDRSERLEFAGRGLFEVASLVIAPAKLAQLAKLDKVADGARLLDKAADTTKAVDNILDGGKAAVAGLRTGGKTPLFKMNLQLFGRGTDDVVKGGTASTKLYHSAGENVVDLIKSNGFRTDLPNPQAAFHNNRFGRGVYLADSPATALAERPGGVIIEVDAMLGKNLNVTQRGIVEYDMAHSIARGARKHGFDSITFNSAQLEGGINTLIFDAMKAIPRH